MKKHSDLFDAEKSLPRIEWHKPRRTASFADLLQTALERVAVFTFHEELQELALTLINNNTQLLGEVEKLLKKMYIRQISAVKDAQVVFREGEYFAHCGADRVLYWFTFGHVAAVSSYGDREPNSDDLLRIYVWNG